MLTKKEISRLSGILKSYYMGEYIPGTYLGEDHFVAHITEYGGNGKFYKSNQIWNARDVALF